MAPVPIAPPEHRQPQSPLICLPTEIQHIIFSYCFVADGPFVDPIVGFAPAESDVVPETGINILRTCRRLYHETDRRPLIAENTFRFTSVDRAHSFFESIDQADSARVQDIEIDVRKVCFDVQLHPFHWPHYLSELLPKHTPALKCLRLNFSSWPLIPLNRKELWDYLGAMLCRVNGLERVVVVGASKGKGMAMQEPWSPVHFVGGDNMGPDELVPRMSNALQESENPDKIVKWERHGGKLYLEVLSRAYLIKHVDGKWAGPCKRAKRTDPWPENGSCTFSEYLNRHSDSSLPTARQINPSAAG